MNVFLRILLVCALLFFAGVAVYKWWTKPSYPHVQIPIKPTPQTPEQQRPSAASRPTPQQPHKQTVQPVSEAPQPSTPPPPTYQLTPTEPSSGSPDTLWFTIQQCHRAGEWVQCFGLAKTNAEIAQHISLQDSRASDDQGRAFNVFLQDGFSFDTGWSEKILPGMPLRFTLRVPDPYPSSKTLNLRLRILYYGENFHVYSDDHTLIYKDIPIQ